MIEPRHRDGEEERDVLALDPEPGGLVERSIRAVALSVLFFFSSRRRHTRFDCDWSSDVCSSDLMLGALPGSKWNYTTAAHLLNRAGFGGAPAEIERLQNIGLDHAVSSFVD